MLPMESWLNFAVGRDMRVSAGEFWLVQSHNGNETFLYIFRVHERVPSFWSVCFRYSSSWSDVQRGSAIRPSSGA